MLNCWQEQPDDRPSFEQLRNELKLMENQHKVIQRIVKFVISPLILALVFLLELKFVQQAQLFYFKHVSNYYVFPSFFHRD